MAIVLDEFDVTIGSGEVIEVVEKHRDRRYGRPADTLLHTIEKGTSGYTRWVDDYVNDVGMVRVHLTPVEAGARVRVELHKIKDRVALEKYARELCEAIQQGHQPRTTLRKDLPRKPPIPGTVGYTWDDTFDWYYRAPREYCSGVGKLAELVGKAKRTVEHYKSLYDAEHDENPLPNDKSKFA